MSITDLLEQVRTETFNLLITGHASNKQSITVLEGWLDKFFDLLQNAIEAGDPTQIDLVLDEWLEMVERWENTSPGKFIDNFLLSIFKVSQNNLSAEQSQELFGNLLPVFFYANHYIHAHEIDFTIAKNNQEQLSLEQLEKSKSDFISVAAHELKTPLTLMEGYSAMLREIIEQKKIFDEHIFMLFDGIDSGSRRLREIINDMIDVSLIDNEMLSLSFQPSWLYKILARVKEDYAAAVQSRQISFSVHRFTGDDILNFYDGDRLFQAISNVVANAIKYTPDGGRIEVNGRLLEDFIEVVIIDNGIGIDPGDQIKIFNKLQPIGEVAFHSSGKLKFKGGGPGLGLPIAKGIIEAHSGRIWVESDGYNETSCPGSTFHILLPIREEPPDLKTANLYEPLFAHKLNRDRDPKLL
jgi:signal transduction histidine kinase